MKLRILPCTVVLCAAVSSLGARHGSLQAWRLELSNLGPLPADLAHAIQEFPRWLRTYKENKGILPWLLVLKFGGCRDVWESEYKRHRELNPHERFYAASVASVEYFATHPNEYSEWLNDVGGPLNAHGWLAYMSWMGFLQHWDSSPTQSRKVHLGEQGEAYGILKLTQHARQCIDSFLHLHDYVDAVTSYPAPADIRSWRASVKILKRGFLRHGTTHLQSTESYCVEWLVSRFLICYMRYMRVPRLQIASKDWVRQLPGPDQQRWKRRLRLVTGACLAVPVLRALNYSGPPELLMMWLCLKSATLLGKRPLRTAAKRHGGQESGTIKLLVHGKTYQTKAQFLSENGCTKSGLSKYKKVRKARIAAADTVVIAGTDPFH